MHHLCFSCASFSLHAQVQQFLDTLLKPSLLWGCSSLQHLQLAILSAFSVRREFAAYYFVQDSTLSRFKQCFRMSTFALHKSIRIPEDSLLFGVFSIHIFFTSIFTRACLALRFCCTLIYLDAVLWQTNAAGQHNQIDSTRSGDLLPSRPLCHI